jgi:photosystem II stability/assembly factor-like uncharacterized protein
VELRFLLAAALLPAALPAQSPFDSLHFRSIGPAATGGRIHDIEVDPKDPSTIYIASASGGIWKTTNKGTFWTPIFDGLSDNTFGDLAICDADPRVLWAGTGEQNNRQSSSWGAGMYRSTDAGRTWTHIGLTSTASIGRVRPNPADCNVAYVAAVGNLWKANSDRGVFKTIDGGKSWSKVLYVDSLTGATDIALDPRDPNTLYAATYQRLRSAFGFNGGGPGSGIYKTNDGGATWKKVENGIPTGDKGRIGLAIAASNPNVLIATIEHASEGGIYRSDDGGLTWRRTSRTNPRPMYYSAPFIDPTNDKRIWLLGTVIVKSEDGGVTFEGQPTSPAYDIGLKTDHHTMWIDPHDSRHVLVGGDGGLNESWDLGMTYIRLNNIPIGQFYHIAVDDRDPYWIYGGLQDNHSWMGPSATRHWLGILNQDWTQIGLSDGTGQQVDKGGYRTIYSSSTDGNVQRVDPETGDRFDIKPQAPKGDSAYRWSWDSPLVASTHTAGTVYLGANRLFISRDRGTTWTRTADLTRNINRDTLTLMGVKDRDIKLSRNDGESSFSEITAIAESPLDAKVLWVGTDDGNVQLSIDGGMTWRELSAAITTSTGIANGTYVGRVLASNAGRGTAYVSFDAHRSGDFAPYIVRTTDFGKTWKSISLGLPGDASVRSIAEYPGKPNVVFAGTERYLFVTLDTGAHWTHLTNNLPTTIYDDIVVHPRTKDLILATHGRSLWLLDDASPIAEWSDVIAARGSFLFPTQRATLIQYWDDVSNMAQGFYAAENPADGAVLTYYLSRPAQKVRLTIRGANGKVIREIAGSTSAGVIHRVTWDLRHEPPPSSVGSGVVAEEAGGGGGAGGGEGGARRLEPQQQLPVPSHDIGVRGPFVAPGTFMVTLNVDGDSSSRPLEVRADPMSTYTLAQQRAREAFLLDVQAAQIDVESVVSDLRARRTAAAGADSARYAALERRLTAGRNAPRAKLGAVARAFNGQGAQQGSFAPPSAVHRQALVESRAELTAVKQELKTLSAER